LIKLKRIAALFVDRICIIQTEERDWI